MCGRFVRTQTPRELLDTFNIPVSRCETAPSYNILPTQPVAVIMRDGEKALVAMKWGLIPGWAKDEKIGSKMINARAETIDQKPSFKKAFRYRRCLIPADGFYEWQQTESGKQPWYFTMLDGQPFTMAGIYEIWKRNDGSLLYSCSIITTEANQLMRPVHHRMPVIIEPHNRDRWLDPECTDVNTVRKMLTQYPADKMVSRKISRLVNNPSNNSRECIIPSE